MPFAGYEDFDACVRANQDKDDPDAYCGAIKHKVEDKAAWKQVSRGIDLIFAALTRDTTRGDAVIKRLTKLVKAFS